MIDDNDIIIQGDPGDEDDSTAPDLDGFMDEFPFTDGFFDPVSEFGPD